MQKKIFLILVALISFALSTNFAYADLDIPGKEILKEVSIHSDSFQDTKNVSISDARNFGGSLLSIARLVVAGFALIYIVIIGANLIVSSDDEGVVAKQKKQLFYSGIAFIFLNIPDVVYRIFMRTDNRNIGAGTWTDVSSQSVFWNFSGVFGADNFISSVISFLKVVAFVAAILSFIWGAIGLMTSRGQDEYKENAQNRMVYGVLGLLFLGIVEAWSYAFTQTGLQAEISKIAGNVFGLAFYFAAPVAVFFLILGAYYYITSAGDEDRASKGKKIFLYTFLASIILLAGASFLNEIIGLTKFLG